MLKTNAAVDFINFLVDTGNKYEVLAKILHIKEQSMRNKKARDSLTFNEASEIVRKLGGTIEVKIPTKDGTENTFALF